LKISKAKGASYFREGVYATMKKFKINITEVQKGYVEVEAKNIDEAEEMHLDEYNNGNVIWTSFTITDVSAEEILPANGGD
jgi:hypothetical protein